LNTGDKIAVGIGDDGSRADQPSRSLIEKRRPTVGRRVSPRQCDALGKSRQASVGPLAEVENALRRTGGKRVVVWILGDPLFYVWNRYLAEKLGQDRFRSSRTSAACRWLRAGKERLGRRF